MRLSLDLLIRLFTAALTLFWLTGCGLLHPKTEVWGGPFGWGFSDTKDNDVTLENLEFDPASKYAKIGKLTIVNNASKPITANVAQITAINEQIRIHGENIARSLGLITALAERALPGLKLEGPLGGSATASNAAVEALIQALAERMASTPAKPQP